MKSEFTLRVGAFFILAGVILLMLFVGSVIGKETNLLFLLFSSAALFLGYILRRGGTKPEPTRFSTIRKARQHARTRREEKKGKNEKKNNQTNSSQGSNR